MTISGNLMQIKDLQVAGFPFIQTGMSDFSIGDLIYKYRKRRGWNQTQLGEAASKFPVTKGQGRINKNTVSNAEHNPYTADFATIWRLLAALNLTLCDAEHRVGNPFTDREVKHARESVSGTRKRQA